MYNERYSQCLNSMCRCGNLVLSFISIYRQVGIMIWICNDILIALCAKYMLIHSITLTDIQFNYR